MSIRSYYDQGFGFVLKDIDGRNVLKALANHERTIERVTGETSSVFTDLYNYFKDNDRFEFFLVPIYFDTEKIKRLNRTGKLAQYGQMGFYLNMLALVITAETGITVNASEGQSDINSSPAILMRKGMPWEYSATDLKTTPDELKRALAPYAKELGVPEDSIGEVEIEYYG